MADAEVAVEAGEVGLGEDVGDEPEILEHRLAGGGGDAGRLLAPMLEGEEPEVGDRRGLLTRCVDAEDAAGLAGRVQFGCGVRPGHVPAG